MAKNSFTEFLTRKSTVDYMKNVVKTGVTMLAVGMLLAAAAPLLSSALLGAGLISGELAAQVAATSIPWTGAFFGAFGAIQAAVAPVIGKIFEPKPSNAALSYVAEATQLQHSPTLSAPTTAVNFTSTQFQDALAAQRIAAQSNTPQVG